MKSFDKLNCGIYCIEHVASGKKYIGSALNFRRRWDRHLSPLRNGKHNSRHLQFAWSKYGEAQFVFRTLVVCAPERLIFYEQLCIDAYQASDSRFGFNIAPTAGSRLGAKMPAAYVEKMRARLTGGSLTEKHKRKISASMRGMQSNTLGKKSSDATKEKIRAAMLNRISPTLGMKFGPETSQKHREAHIRNGRAKMSMEAATSVRARVAAGERRDAIAAEYNVALSTIGQIIRGNSWPEQGEAP